MCEFNIAPAVWVHKRSSLLGSIVSRQQPAPGLEKVFLVSTRPVPGGKEPGPSRRHHEGVTPGLSHQSSYSPGASAGLAWGLLLPGQSGWTGSGLCVIDSI